jgi:hypothetical protein
VALEIETSPILGNEAWKNVGNDAMRERIDGQIRVIIYFAK